jgi:plasmid stabilization system protein ParE
MNHSLIIRPEAEHDLAEAYRWYESQREGLGRRFITATDMEILSIREHPRLYPVVHNGIRRALVHHFPFGIFYRLAYNQIVVIAVMHCRRNPNEWKQRI